MHKRKRGIGLVIGKSYYRFTNTGDLEGLEELKRFILLEVLRDTKHPNPEMAITSKAASVNAILRRQGETRA